MKHAVAISYNWETEKVLYTPFTGEEAGIKAMNWVSEGSFIWKDFPASKGWHHFYSHNQEAAVEKGKILTDRMFAHLPAN